MLPGTATWMRRSLKRATTSGPWRSRSPDADLPQLLDGPGRLRDPARPLRLTRGRRRCGRLTGCRRRITIGGEIARRAGEAETGLIDIVELPAAAAASPHRPAPAANTGCACWGRGPDAGRSTRSRPSSSRCGEAGLCVLPLNCPRRRGRAVLLLRCWGRPWRPPRPARTPQVTIQAPGAGSYTGRSHVRWTGSTPDAGTTLQYTVLLDSGDSARWQAVA